MKFAKYREKYFYFNDSFMMTSCPIWYKIMSNNCDIFLPIFLFHCFSQVATTFTLTSETSLIIILLNCIPSNATTKSHLKFKEHKFEESFSDGIRDVQLGRFILLSVPVSHQLLRLNSLSPLVFSIVRWNMTALFVDNIQVILNN